MSIRKGNVASVKCGAARPTDNTMAAVITFVALEADGTHDAVAVLSEDEFDAHVTALLELGAAIFGWEVSNEEIEEEDDE